MSDQFLSNLEHLRTLGECIEEDEREAFGVQNIPLLNLLKPEELDWHVFHS